MAAAVEWSPARLRNFQAIEPAREFALKLALPACVLYAVKDFTKLNANLLLSPMSLNLRLTVVAVCAVIVVPAAAHSQNPAPPKDTAAQKADTATTDTIDKSTLTGFYEVAPGRGLTITLEKDTLYGAPSSGEKRKLIYQSGLAFLVDGTKMTLTFILGADGSASSLMMQQNGQTRIINKTR